MKHKCILLAFIALLSCSALQSVAQETGTFREALKLYDYGMFSHSRHRFEGLDAEFTSDPAGYALLCDVRQRVPGYQRSMDKFIYENPQSSLIPQILYVHSLNLFDTQDYGASLAVMDGINPKHLDKSQRVEFLFKKAYSSMETGDAGAALKGFEEVEKMPVSDYTAPSRYALGYINYDLKRFEEAIKWFEKSGKDGRFADMSSYYIMECRFMLGDHDYVASHGDALYERTPQERRPQLARMISESWLVLGDAEKARRYMDLNTLEGGQPKGRADWFYRGSVLYAVKDYRGAIDNFSMMGERTDSIGQIASYQMGYSYIQTRNKVAALDAFHDASILGYDEDLAEDACFNYAKLAFDLNSDTSVFYDYLKKYSDMDKGERIYSYIALAALYNRDYAGAVDAYDKIDYLDGDMKNNYMKANYLRAKQLIDRGSYRLAVPCLKAAAYYSERNTRFNQLSRFWLAESYYRNDQYAVARAGFMDLYNTSALYGMPESGLLAYNIAYCHYRMSEYGTAGKWFAEYRT